MKPEVMSPAGYWPQLTAAVEAGADSVYFGLTKFTARAKVGFTIEELPEVFRTLHARGVRGFVTFNTLVFEDELRDAARTIAAIAEAGADALIVQDVGILKLAREIAPDLELHASTQMSITNADGARAALRMGVKRVTLARELSLSEIASIQAAAGCELEVFVHGALCVAYSGQCFSSEAWGGRSANRGQCAQACRLPYELIVDGTKRTLGDARYLLSPGDLYALEQVPELACIGVAALKIEGRYKDADYVALTTKAYRDAVDAAAAGLPAPVSPEEKLRLEQAYSRGLGPFFLTGTNHQQVVKGRAPRHRGVLMGQVVRSSPGRVEISVSDAHAIAPLKAGDGIVFDAADWRDPSEQEEGGRVYAVEQLASGRLALAFANGAIHPARIKTGDLVWRTHDPDLHRAAKPYTDAAAPVALQPVSVRVHAAAGQPLLTTWTCKHVQVEVASDDPLASATNRPLTEGFVADQLGRLGNTPYTLAQLDLHVTGSPFVPSSLLNQIRRRAVELLQARQSAGPHISISDPDRVLDRVHVQTRSGEIAEPQLHVLVRTPEQLEAALRFKPASITLDYLDLYGLKPSVERLKASGITARVASPRILKPGEEKIVNFLLSLDTDILVRSGGLLEMLRERTHRSLVGDFSLNAANSLAADLLLASGLQRITPTHDLNASQITDLATHLGAGALEVIAYQHLPVFHTEHCVFCRFLSTGTTFKDCGRPCETHTVSVRDTSGRSHPVMADIGCRNTVFGAEAQEASAFLPHWLACGIRHFRLEFAHETCHQVDQVIDAMQRAITGKISPPDLARLLRKASPEGVTQGSLLVPNGHPNLVVLHP